jgi:hypothetical protein
MGACLGWKNQPPTTSREKMPRPHTFLRYQLNRSKARNFANATLARLPTKWEHATGGIPNLTHVRFEAINGAALDAYHTWESPCFSWEEVVQWKAKELMYFDLSIWLDRELCGLCFANPNHSRLRMRIVRLEAKPGGDHSLRGYIAPLALMAVEHYVRIVGSKAIEIQEPLPGAVPAYEKLGFTFDGAGRLAKEIGSA